MDTATEELRREGWLGEDEELNFLLREGKAFLNRGNLLDDRSHLEKDRHKTKETRRLEKEMEDDAWVKANVVAGEYFDIKAGGLFAEKHFGKMLDGKVEEIGYFGKGISSCAICDGSIYKEKVVGVIGGGDSALLEAQYLSDLAKKSLYFC